MKIRMWEVKFGSNLKTVVVSANNIKEAMTKAIKWRIALSGRLVC